MKNNNEIKQFTINIKQGWNLIAGSLNKDCIILDNDIVEKIDSIYTVYYFSERYILSGNIINSKGNWLRAKKNGTIIIEEI